MASPLVPLAALGLGIYYLVTRSGSGSVASSAPWPEGAPPESASPVPLYAGVPYLFLVRLEKSEQEARAALEPKGVENLLFTPSGNPPAYAAPGESFGTTTASFKFVPRGNSASVTLGLPMYGIGRLEQLVRLDGRPFSEAPSV